MTVKQRRQKNAGVVDRAILVVADWHFRLSLHFVSSIMMINRVAG